MNIDPSTSRKCEQRMSAESRCAKSETSRKENINTADNVLSRLSIIDKARALAWYQDVEFEKPFLVNVDNIGYGTERFYVVGATTEGVYAYPKSDFYKAEDADLLDCWCSGRPYIEKDADSGELERILDEGLRATGLDKDNPVLAERFEYPWDSLIFEGTDPTI